MLLQSLINIVRYGKSGSGVGSENQRVFFIGSERAVVTCVIANWTGKYVGKGKISSPDR
jgi:hypothetical protein